MNANRMQSEDGISDSTKKVGLKKFGLFIVVCVSVILKKIYFLNLLLKHLRKINGNTLIIAHSGQFE